MSATEPRGSRERCAWCGADVEREEGYRLAEPAGARRAAFCRLEHVVPWAMQGPHWDVGEIEEPSGLQESLERCSQCGETLTDTVVVLVRRRGEHRIPDAFCSVDHLRAWAAAGGRFGGV